MENYIALAREIAEFAHRDQKRKYNPSEDFITHPQRVAYLIDPGTSNYTAKVCAAWLHDVIEDTDITADWLRSQGLPEDIVFAVECLTHNENETRKAYYNRVLKSPIAIHVKFCDVADNLGSLHVIQTDDPELIPRLRAKYTDAFKFFAAEVMRGPNIYEEY